LDALETNPKVYDTSRVYLAGCSMGAALSLWQTMCLEESAPGTVRGIATHSTGLKVKGDGLGLPYDYNDPRYGVGECPECESWPTVLQSVGDGVKACVFDNKADPLLTNNYFYKSSVALAEQWTAQPGNSQAETHFANTGGHCFIHSIEDMVTCLDNGTGYLTAADATTTTTTAPTTTVAIDAAWAIKTESSAPMTGVAAGVALAAVVGHVLGAFRRRR
jgi:hypothetical protein